MERTTLRRLYGLAPGGGQTVLLNLYGLRNRRRQAAWKALLRPLAGTETLEPAAQLRWTQERLRDVLRHALEHVPRYSGYRRLLVLLDGPDGAFETLNRLPPVTRDEVLDDPRSFLSTALRSKRLTATHTSGTTGTPFTTWMEPRVRALSDALWWRRTLWAGYRPGDWVARLVGDPVVPLGRGRSTRPWRVSRVDRRIYLSTFHLDAATAREFLGVLDARRPAFLMGYPSALEYLARIARETGWSSGWRPRAILFSSEPLHEHQEEALQQAFQAPIRGLYGCAERIVSAAQCEGDQYHLSLVDGYVEGQFGLLPTRRPALITGLLNRAMPLIRFQLGDLIEPLPGFRCSCGRTLPVIAPVLTKTEDCVTTPSGRIISPSVLTWAFKDLQGLRRAQIQQIEPATLRVLLAPREIPPAEACRLEEQLRRLTFGEMALQMEPCDEIPPAASGKTRFVVNLRRGSPPSGLDDRHPGPAVA